MRKNFIFLSVGLTLAFTLFFGATAYAAVDADSTGLNATAGAAGLLSTSPTDVPTLIGNVIGTLLSMVGVLFFLLMLYGGVLWMTARGNEDQTTKSMHTIIAASIGIVIVLASYALTNFVFKSVGGSDEVPAAGAPAGGGNGAPAINWDNIANCADAAGWSCKDINNCGLDVADIADVNGKRAVCAINENQCQLGKCQQGGNEIVCCKD